MVTVLQGTAPTSRSGRRSYGGSGTESVVRPLLRAPEPYGPIMISLPGVTDTITWLKTGPLRDFDQPLEGPQASGVMTTLTPDDVPVPALWQATLELIDLSPRGPGEKVLWWINFTYKTVPCTLAHEKFGIRLYVLAGGEERAKN